MRRRTLFSRGVNCLDGDGQGEPIGIGVTDLSGRGGGFVDEDVIKKKKK